MLLKTIPTKAYNPPEQKRHLLKPTNKLNMTNTPPNSSNNNQNESAKTSSSASIWSTYPSSKNSQFWAGG